MKVKKSELLNKIGSQNYLKFPADYVKEGWMRFSKDTLKYFILRETFVEALDSASDKLYTEKLLSNSDDGEWFFLSKGVGFLAKTENNKITFFVLDVPKNSVLFYFSNSHGDDKFWSVNVSNNNNIMHDVTIITLFKNRIITLINFIKYANIETNYIKANSKLNITRKEGKVVNETDIDFTILDSTWFTNIVRNEGFKVRGHFRLQPYKTGKQLIYIKEYQKKGYHRKATKETKI